MQPDGSSRYVWSMSRIHVLPSPEATAAFASSLAPHLAPGDTLLLEGSVGAGKSFFARALIHARQRQAGVPEEDVPSPTFTLVQTYVVAGTEIWHADLYRLSSPDEVFELGLDAAWEIAICLIEWPDRLGQDAPSGAVTLHFRLGDVETARTLSLTGTNKNLIAKLEGALNA